MKTNDVVLDALDAKGWFNTAGVYVLVDGQFGSTGKGLLSAVLGEYGNEKIEFITSNAGPNSGHTAYCPISGNKIMTQQLPVSSVIIGNIIADDVKEQGGEFLQALDMAPMTYLNAGAVIDIDILNKECAEHSIRPVIHPHAPVIRTEDIEAEKFGGPSKIATTAKGVGAAIASKVMRENPGVGCRVKDDSLFNSFIADSEVHQKNVVFVETSQGFSLGINSGFYPHCTSRECTVGQALADARFPARSLRKVAACYRTFPIRVGNTDKGYSGDCYQDQEETTWEDVGFPPELTTVTKRVRRVFTWSWIQFRESLLVNEPDLVFINFLQYIKQEDRVEFLDRVSSTYLKTLNRPLELMLVGYGPLNSDVYLYEKSKVWFRNEDDKLECKEP